MSPISILVLALVAIGAGVYVWRKRHPALSEAAVGDPATVARGGLVGKQVGAVVWSGVNVPARIDPRSERDVMASGTSVFITGVENDVALVSPKD